MSKVVFEGYRNAPEWITVFYDFAEDGGAIGAIDLFELKDNVIVHDIVVEQITAPTSAGAATVEIGVNGGDTDGFLAQAAYDALEDVSGDQEKGALLWDDTNDASKRYKVDSSTGVQIDLTIATAALTAGKLAISLLVSGGN